MIGFIIGVLATLFVLHKLGFIRLSIFKGKRDD